jgi:Fe-S-cluster-containing dehydrogenase component
MSSYRSIPITRLAPSSGKIVCGDEKQTGEADLANRKRRRFLKLMAASTALASASCSGPPQEIIVPYVQMPEQLVPGQPLFYASSFIRRGYAYGVLIESNMGRPTKIEGNPRHPASLGSTDVFAQASILQLWDPDRSQTVYHGGLLSTWNAFEAALQPMLSEWGRSGGAGLRILTGCVTSPTLADQLAGLLERYPNARWHSYDPLHDDGAVDAAQRAFGKAVDTVFRFEHAALVLSLDADVFGDGPGSLRYARDFMRTRRSDSALFSNRLYAVESTPSLTGAMADERLTLPPQDIERLIWRLAARIGVPGIADIGGGSRDATFEKWERVLAQRLATHRGQAVIVAGANVPARTRALVHLLNAHLGNVGNAVLHIQPVETTTASHLESIATLTADMQSGQVNGLVMLGGNPVYNAPADLDFAQALAKVPFSVHLNLYRDETSHLATWHIPQTHLYEQWSDARAYDGTASIVQPAIVPLYGGRSSHELISVLSQDTARSGYALVRRHWQRRTSRHEFDAFWRTALMQGIVADSAHAVLDVQAMPPPAPPSFQPQTLTALFQADPSADDGEYANNAWLQELPRPFSKLTWDNAVLLGPATARRFGIESGDVVRLYMRERPTLAIEAPVWILPGQAEETVTLPLGYGRTVAGRIGNRVGFNAYRLKTLAATRGTLGLAMQKTGRRHAFASTRDHASMEGRDIVRMTTLDKFRRDPHFAADTLRERVPSASLYPQWQYRDYKWGMAIDLNSCIGCNACTIACQAENNIPVVGKEEVMRGREMHWIRVDRYYADTAASSSGPRTVFQPVPCMHCENAPCEEVCPVGATVHDSEGLNLQVYNRCVGTRFCSNNCPYKVRRFNFFQYANNDIASLKAAQNPDVSVRRRGVMEKCTYCVQRITRARLDAEKLGRHLRDGEVVTACQAVCPTQAIVFGDLNDPNSQVNRSKAAPLDYALLSELNTRPRTTYAARVINRDPELE